MFSHWFLKTVLSVIKGPHVGRESRRCDHAVNPFVTEPKNGRLVPAGNASARGHSLAAATFL